MFTGIIESLGKVVAIEKDGNNVDFTLSCAFVDELSIDQSVAHNGVCLTVVKLTEDTYTVTAIDETLRRTNLSDWKVGTLINLERCLLANGRFDGHIVQGHVDTVGVCKSIEEKDGSWEFVFTYDYPEITVEKGAITVNGTSLTVVDSEEKKFSVHVIPYTYRETIFHQIAVDDKVNLEFDIIGKYIAKMLRKTY